MTWLKSSYSGHCGECVEVRWLKSSKSAIEVATASEAPEEMLNKSRKIDAAVYVRDSKNPNGPVLEFTQSEWDAFILGVKDGEFDHLGNPRS